jgi:hypothetical protein
MSFTLSEYEHLIDLLNRYRISHDQDRASRHALQLLVEDLEEDRLQSRHSEVIDLEKRRADIAQNAALDDLEDIIRGYGVPDGMDADDIVLTLADDRVIDPKNADHYYRALVAAQTVLDEIGQ